MHTGVIKINKTDTQFITEMSQTLTLRFKTRDPFFICERLGVNVRYKDLGSIKGIYTFYKRNRFIVVNSLLCDDEKKIVCAHELGHDLLHRNMAKNAHLYDAHLNDLSLKPEFEANVFAAELLISDDSVITNIDVFSDTSSLAGELGVSEALLKIKCSIMKNRGIDIKCKSEFDFNIFK